jgi:DNA-binding Lrp family transcriptional regulator
MQDRSLKDADLRLVDALQIWPRAPWSAVASVLDEDPVTIARRWARISEGGLAWVVVQPPTSPDSRGGLVEVECVAGSIAEVVEELAADPECVSIEVCSGARDLMLTITCPSARAFNDYLIGRVSAVLQIRAVRAHPVIRMLAGGSRWRLRHLDAEQAAAVRLERDRGAARMREVHGRRTPKADPQIITLLGRDGRMTSSMVATELGIPTRRARERLSATLASGLVELRTDMPRWASGWPVSAWYFIRVPAARLPDVGAQLQALRAVRTIFSVAGPANVLVTAWLKELADVEGLEAFIEQRLPSVRVLDRSLVLSVRKRVGRVFDEKELPRQIVPAAS